MLLLTMMCLLIIYCLLFCQENGAGAGAGFGVGYSARASGKPHLPPEVLILSSLCFLFNIIYDNHYYYIVCRFVRRC
jgi:preprotein translocase subunit SecG